VIFEFMSEPITIDTLHQVELQLMLAVQSILRRGGLHSILQGENELHPGDFIGVRVALPQAADTVWCTADNSTWHLRWHGVTVEVEISRQRMAQHAAELDPLYQHFWVVAGKLRQLLAAQRVVDRSIFWTHDFPSMTIAGATPELQPAFNIGSLLPVGSTLSYREQFDEDMLVMTWSMAIGVNPLVLDAVVEALG
jgi:hypothetical protein